MDLFNGDCLDFLPTIPDGSVQLVMTSPPYNLNKEYEDRLSLVEYTETQRKVITECVRVLTDNGSICWQTGNYVDNGRIVPLDILLYPVFESLGLKLRNRIVWHFEHGLHCKKRLSGRYETVLWFSKSDGYIFDLDSIRVPQKYPNKRYFKGPNKGKLSCNPLGKNPGDVWIIPNVKANHCEKTVHPAQYPVELVERFVLALTKTGDLTLDPFMGVGTTQVASVMHGRRTAGAEIRPDYYRIALDRISRAQSGDLQTRPMNREVPKGHDQPMEADQ